MPRVLILEDEKVVARDLQGILGTLGYETSMAASGEDALAVAKQDRPDLALVDIHLDGALDGIETAQAMHQMELPVVYLTAHADEQTLERAKATEPLAFLVKPFSEPSLKATIQMAVHKAGLEKRNRDAEKWRSALLHQLTVALIATDDAVRVTAINARAQSVTGWSEADAVGKSATEVLCFSKVEQAPAIQTLVDQGLQGRGEAAPLHVKVVSRAGAETEVELRTSPLADESGKIVGLSFVFGPLRNAAAAATAAPGEKEAGEPEFDRVTGLPGRTQALAALDAAKNDPANLFAAILVLDRYFATSRRYGNATADEVLTYYCTFLAQEVQAAPHCRGLFRWSGPSFLAVFGPWDSVMIAQREISRSARVKLVEEFMTSSHSVLLPVSATTKVFALREEELCSLIEQIDAFVASQTKSGTL